MLLLSRADVEQVLDRDALRDAIAAVMIEVSAGRVSLPSRVAAERSEPFGVMAAMPAYVPALDAMATKVVNVFPANAGTGLPTHEAIIVLADPGTGDFLAMLDGDVITAERTAAGSAVSADVLAPRDAEILAVVGTGVQARSHALAVSRVRPFTSIRIAGRNAAAAAALAADVAAEVDVDVTGSGDVEAACRGAVVVCATTDSPTPIIRRDWLDPSAHVTSVGFAPGGPEIGSDIVHGADVVVVETRATASDEYPVGTHEIRAAIESGGVDPTRLVELGELAAAPGRHADARDRLSLYKSAGIAAQDVAAARLVFDAATRRGVGARVER
ncbi:MAG: ornithine cyclodeaminase family protein [Actinomycetota bacterium]